MEDVGGGVYSAMNLQLGVYNPLKFEICETPPKTMRLLKPKTEIRWDLGDDAVAVQSDILRSDLRVFPWAFHVTRYRNDGSARYAAEHTNGITPLTAFTDWQNVSESTLLMISYLLFTRTPEDTKQFTRTAKRFVKDSHGHTYLRLRTTQSNIMSAYSYRLNVADFNNIVWVHAEDTVAVHAGDNQFDAVRRCVYYLREKLPQASLWPCRPKRSTFRFLILDHISDRYWHQVLLPGLTYTAGGKTGVTWAKKQVGDEQHVDVYISFPKDNNICEIAWDDILA